MVTFDEFMGRTKQHEELQYINFARYLLEHGVYRKDRTGVGTYSAFGYQMRFDLSKSFPLLTTKKVAWKAMVKELKWFLMGDTNIRYLKEHNVRIWDEWADENGDLGPIYGKQWRSWPVGLIDGKETAETIDQIANVINTLKRNPESRRLIVSAWNPALIEKMALPPCHAMFQFDVADGKLSCQLYQRSADWFLGVPFNIASYSLLTHMIAHVTGLEVGDYVHTFGNAHIYSNHIEQMKTQIERVPYEFPQVKIIKPADSISDISEIDLEDIELIDYKTHPAIKGQVAV